MNDFVLDLREHDEEHAIFELSALMLFPHPVKRNDSGYFRDWVKRVAIGVAATHEKAGDQARLGEWIGSVFEHYEISWSEVAQSLFVQSKRPLPIQATRDRRAQGLQAGFILARAIVDGHGIQGACAVLAEHPLWRIKGRNVAAKNKENREKAIRKVFTDFRSVSHLWSAFIKSLDSMKRTPGGLLPLGSFSPGGLTAFVDLGMDTLELASTITTKTRPNDPLLSKSSCWRILI